MIRPALEVADILRALRNRFLKRFKSSRSYQQLKAFRAIERCRTAALGGHRDKCVGCEYEAPFSYNSCRSRCCPKCQARARQRWIEARQRELLPTNYFHVVFTVPHELNGFARTSPAATTTCCSRPAPRHCSKWQPIRSASAPRSDSSRSCIPGDRTCFSIHISTVSCPPADYLRTISAGYTLLIRVSLPAPSLRIAFRTKFLEGLAHLYGKGLLDCRGPRIGFQGSRCVCRDHGQLKKERWVVDIRPPFGGPEQVLRYLGRYTHRIAISNHRLVSFDGKRVRFRWKDYAHGGRRGIMKLKATEFLRRFFLHVLPKGFVRIRHYGLLSNRFRKQCLPLAQKLLAADGRYPLPRPAPKDPTESTPLWHCPKCGRPMRVARRFTAAELSSGQRSRFLMRLGSITDQPTCFPHACACVCPTLHTRPFHRSSLSIYRARQATTRFAPHLPPSPSAPIHPAEAHTPIYKQHSIPIIPA